MRWQDGIQVYDYVEYQAENADLANVILSLSDDVFDHRSHFFHGRYENLYIDIANLSGLKPVLEMALSKSAELLQQPATDLKLGFWLNLMNKGDVTTLHSHDDDDELLSAVYYIQVPTGSGMFKLHYADEVKEIEPVAGRFMFFDPSLPHEVCEHQNDIPRISIGINIGPAGS